jgi:protein-L-isoaspartate(D-aspartate) O-methyltransferase
MSKSNIIASGQETIPLEIKKIFINRLKSQGIQNNLVLNIMQQVPRHLFVEPALKKRAYDDDALPIGFSQTISSPYIVAKMTELIIENDNMQNVLEVGTGSGYQSAILALLFKYVTTMERIKPLYERTQKYLKEMGFKNIKCVFDDGFKGYSGRGPYDAIIMTASPTVIPKFLLSQLKPTGRMILPLNTNGKQKLFRIKNTKNGILKKEIDDVLFVPMLEGTDK